MANEETIPQMRERIDQQNEQLKQLGAENRRLIARETFREAGLKPDHGDLFAAQDAKSEITVDTVKAFASQFGLIEETPATDAEVETTPAAAEQGDPADEVLSQMSSGGSGAGEGGAASTKQRMTRDEWTELSKTDPSAARQALLQGQVQLRKDNFYVQNHLVRG